MRHRKQREIAKENDFFVQLLRLALPNEEQPVNDAMQTQGRPSSELLHSTMLGDIDLPISSPLIGIGDFVTTFQTLQTQMVI